MNVERTPKNPSPLAGEDAARSAAGEGRGDAVSLGGKGSRGPSPVRSLRSQTTSPAKGEGKIEEAARSAAGEGRGGAVSLSGKGSRGPSPVRSLRSRTTSPARGEGKSGAAIEKFAGDRTIVRRARALRLRLHMTDAERKLWYALRDRRFAGFKFRRQAPIGPFIADFVCFDRRLVIEVDGGQHAGSLRDRQRDRWFAANEFRVLRFWNNEVLSNLDGVMTVRAQALKVEWS
jgi:very-short-patch-repair endonuclease